MKEIFAAMSCQCFFYICTDARTGSQKLRRELAVLILFQPQTQLYDPKSKLITLFFDDIFSHDNSILRIKNSKLYLRHFPFGFVFDFEEVAFGKAEHPGDDVRREHLDLVVVEQHLVIVALAGEGNLVFRAG